MRFERTHRREIAASATTVGALIDTLGSEHDRLWPSNRWPTLAIEFDRELGVGAKGGHGPIRYFVSDYTPSEGVEFCFDRGSGVEGTHRLYVQALGPGRSRLTHTVDATLGLRYAVILPAFRAMHDAVLGDLLDRAELHATGRVARPSATPRWLLALYAIDRATSGRAMAPLGERHRPGTGVSALKLRLVRIVQRRIVNPPVRLMWRHGFMPSGFALLETTGRVTGRPRLTPVGDGLVGGTFWVIAEHGTKASYVRNLQANPSVRVRLRQRGHPIWRNGIAHLMPGDDPAARQRTIVGSSIVRRINSIGVRLMGTDLLTVRIDLDPSESRSGD
jgi:deazaflavin-dependent oxidoreductase (nitroreductase family)